MASIAKEKNGNRRILFVDVDGKRKTIRLGKVSQRSAEKFKLRVEELSAAKTMGHPIPSDVAVWVSSLGIEMISKLERVGLIPKQARTAITRLSDFLTEYIEGRHDVKPATKVVWSQVKRNLIDFFGTECDISEINVGNADRFKQYLIAENLAPTTVHKRLQFARSFFRSMVRQKLISENPFADIKSPARVSSARQRFVTRDEIETLMEHCPDHHWRTIIALARYGGLRCPSEVLSLNWQDINWETNRICVPSPKTEHHPGKVYRIIPLFSELREPLETAFELADDGTIYVVDERFRKACGPNGWINCNIRTSFEKIIRRAGLQKWLRIFHNLRASRETELVEQFPVQVVTSWLGNSPTIALKHYLMTTDDHYEKAVGIRKAVHNPAQ